ncbi:MAG TPA: proline racemase family protein [Armatimonadota bacterium]|jgi:4-hydroxyproline epimerase
MTSGSPHIVRVIDSHTGGEPTRVVLEGGPALSGATVADRCDDFRLRFGAFRSAVINEPRGSDVMVGALLVEPTDPEAAAGVVFFNNVGVIGMCGHAAIGLVTTLARLGRIGPGEHRIETPVGTVAATLHLNGEVSIRNVPAYRHAKAVTVHVDGHGDVTGDVAWGGNWFFLVEAHGQDIDRGNTENLIAFCWAVRIALESGGITGRDGAPIDHIELFAPGSVPKLNSRNFVLCPGKAYDRSPCGTGTSAKLACMLADGRIREGEIWRQESITGSVFEASVGIENGEVIPTIRGRAFVTAEANLILDPVDPFCWGIR